MLPKDIFIKTNFIDGIKFNPKQIALNEKLIENKLSLLSLYGVGRGVLIGFFDSLKVVVEDNSLILKPGAGIDGEGNIIFVPKEYQISKDIEIDKYENRTKIYIYLSFETKMDNLDFSKKDKNLKIYYNILEEFRVTLSLKEIKDITFIELARVSINHKISNKIKNPLNPFEPKENEIDLRYVDKIVGSNILIKEQERKFIAETINKFGEFLHQFSFRKKIFSMATISSLALKISLDISSNNSITTWQIYQMLKTLFESSKKIKIEREDIIQTGFWKNIVRIEEIFDFKDKMVIDYYNLFLLNEESFFYKITLHFLNATIFDGDWDSILKEKREKKEVKDYIIVGSGVGCDIVVEGEDIAKEHAKIYKYKTGYFIEDLPNSSGVYVNSIRVEKGVKKFIRKQDYVSLGKNGKVLNLQNIKL